ncbi:carbohydrate kinase [bacterium endosymbiont of Escarpia laminata]|nr:MAG: carbohydrate kinase [bacterium endosymbiont of Escarpia laminata]
MDSCIGIDLGTSGVRAIAIDSEKSIIAEAVIDLPPPKRGGEGSSEQRPECWWDAVLEVLLSVAQQIKGGDVQAIAVDGTSSTLLLCDPQGSPLTTALMYNDSRSKAHLPELAQAAPASSPVNSASSSLAKLLYLRRQIDTENFLALHQADWILGRLSGHFGLSDENNCLKLGYDPVQRCWPTWMESLALPSGCLPDVRPPGTVIGRLSAEVANATGVPASTRIVTGTTDSNAAALATGAAEIGDAVTSLGSTLVLKILSDQPVFAAEFGIYSHRLGEHWLVGGASNSGGAVCADLFSREEMATLTQQIEPDNPTELDYYPLLQPGERFPLNDPGFAPRLEPRPEDDARYFQGILEGIANIEREGYALLQRLGAPVPRRVISIGGGAGNEPWRRIRERLLGIPVERAVQQQAAYGTALLALAAVS